MPNLHVTLDKNVHSKLKILSCIRNTPMTKLIKTQVVRLLNDRRNSDAIKKAMEGGFNHE